MHVITTNSIKVITVKGKCPFPLAPPVTHLEVNSVTSINSLCISKYRHTYAHTHTPSPTLLHKCEGTYVLYLKLSFFFFKLNTVSCFITLYRYIGLAHFLITL